MRLITVLFLARYFLIDLRDKAKVPHLLIGVRIRVRLSLSFNLLMKQRNSQVCRKVNFLINYFLVYLSVRNEILYGCFT